MALTKVSGDILDTGIVVAGVTTSTNFKTGTSNLHSSGIEIAGINVLGADTPIGAGVTIYNSGGADFTGVVTATRFVGQADISGGSITATTGTFSGDVSIGGTLTYEDVTNIDSVGIITARNAIILSEDNAIHFRGSTDSDRDAILRASAGGGQLLINSRNDTILNIDSNDDSTDAHFAVAHGAATGSSTELFRVQENGQITQTAASGDTILTLKRSNTNTTGLVGGINFAASDDHSVASIQARGDGDNEGAHLQFYTTTAAAGDMFNAATVERVRITSDGKFGIGVTPISIFHVRPLDETNFLVRNEGSTVVLASETNNGRDNNRAMALEASHFEFIEGGSEKLRIDSSGRLLIGTTVAPSSANTLLRVHTPISSSSANSIEIGHDTNGADKAGAALGLAIGNGGASTNAADLYFSTATNGSLTQKLWIRSDGHITPANAGTQDLGSTSKEFRNLYLGDQGKVYFGLDQDMTMEFDGSNALLGLQTGNLSIIAYDNNKDVKILSDNGSGGVTNYFVADGSNGRVVLNHYGTEKFATSEKGITVTGEVAASQDYPNYRPTLDFNFAAVKKLDPRITYSRTGPASYTDEFGIVKLVGANTPRFDHDPVTRECKGLLIEEERSNYLIYSEMLEDWNFGVGTDVFTASSGSQLSDNPDGSSPAYHYAPSSTAGHHRFNRGVTVPTLNTNYVVSVFVKRVTAGTVSNLNRYVELEVTGNFNGNSAGTGQSGSNGGSHVVYDLQNLTIHNGQADNTNGYVGDSKLEDYGNGWYRCSYVFNPGSGSHSTGHVWWGHPSATAGDSGNETGNGSPSFYFWGASIEKGSFLTSYIPTNGETVTRGSDDLVIDGEDLTDFHNQPEGTILADYKVIGGYPQIMYLSNNTASRRIGLYEAGSAQTRFLIGNSGTLADTTDSAGTTVGDNIKSAGAYKLNDVAAAKNGVISSTDSSVTIPDDIDRAYIGGYFNGDVSGVLGLRRLVYYQQRLPNSQLVTLTA